MPNLFNQSEATGPMPIICHTINNTALSRLLTPREACDVLGLKGERSLRRCQDEGLPVIRLGYRTKRYLLVDVLAWAKSRQSTGRITMRSGDERRGRRNRRCKPNGTSAVQP